MISRAAILSTGDELVTGRTVDTNATFIAEQLNANGIDVVAALTVGDWAERIRWAWQEGMRQAELLISTGGLGPTADDLTTEVMAEVVGRPLRLDEEVAERIRQLFAAMGRTMPENNLKQARFPEDAVILPNRLGTAPGYRLEVASEHGRRHLVVLPGVPREMKPMLTEQVLPWLATARGSDEVFASRTFQTFGLSESALDELVAGCVAPEEGRVAFRAAFPQIAVRVTVHGAPHEVDARLAHSAARLRERLGEYCYSEGDVTMETVVGELMREQRKTLAVAESCTGGLIGHRLTEIPGSSAYLRADIVAYDNAIKTGVLKVHEDTLAAHGAVSEETAEEMARGVRALAGADLGLSTTGIAGPEGGTPDKPVGTVCIALATAERTYSHRYQLWGTRGWIKLLTSQVALDWIRRFLLGKPPNASQILRK